MMLNILVNSDGAIVSEKDYDMNNQDFHKNDFEYDF